MRTRYSLIHRGNRLPLGLGTALVGRTVGCKLRLDGDEVSRRHARLTVADELLIVEDLGSENGVFVNEERLDRPRRLEHGDRILVGGHELRVVVDDVPLRRATPPAPVKAASGGGTIDSLWDDDGDQVIHRQGADTSSRDPQVMFCTAVLNELDAGQCEQAERLLSTLLSQVIRDISRGGSRSQQLATLATSGAARLAQATGKASWVERAFEVYAACRVPILDEALILLEQALPKIDATGAPAVRRHLATLRQHKRDRSKVERHLLAKAEQLAAD